MRALASQPRGDAGLTGAEHPLGGGTIQPFGQRSQHRGDVMGGGLQTVKRGMGPSSERRVTGLASECLDALAMTMLAIPNERVDVRIGDPEVQTLLLGTGKALRVHASGGLPAGFSPQARDAQQRALALPPTWEWRRDDRRGNRLGSEARADGGAWGASWQLLVTVQDHDMASKETKAGAGRA